jgi:HSP20 family protein
MNMSRFEPWNLANLLHHDVSRLAIGRHGLSTVANGEKEATNWLPPVDIVEEDARFLLRADVPGVKAENIEIDMEKGVLSISGNRATDPQEEGQSVQRKERTSGRFVRRFTLPDTTDADDISASCADGILEIVIPKQPAVQARKITVKAA